jgi:hypothetical protein
MVGFVIEVEPVIHILHVFGGAGRVGLIREHGQFRDNEAG